MEQKTDITWCPCCNEILVTISNENGSAAVCNCGLEVKRTEESLKIKR